MRVMVALAALLFFAFLAGCTSKTSSGTEDQLPQANPTPTPAQQISQQDADQELNDFGSGLISEDDNIEIGEII